MSRDKKAKNVVFLPLDQTQPVSKRRFQLAADGFYLLSALFTDLGLEEAARESSQVALCGNDSLDWWPYEFTRALQEATGISGYRLLCAAETLLTWQLVCGRVRAWMETPGNELTYSAAYAAPRRSPLITLRAFAGGSGGARQTLNDEPERVVSVVSVAKRGAKDNQHVLVNLRTVANYKWLSGHGAFSNHLINGYRLERPRLEDALRRDDLSDQVTLAMTEFSKQLRDAVHTLMIKRHS